MQNIRLAEKLCIIYIYCKGLETMTRIRFEETASTSHLKIWWILIWKMTAVKKIHNDVASIVNLAIGTKIVKLLNLIPYDIFQPHSIQRKPLYIFIGEHAVGLIVGCNKQQRV